MYSSEKLHEINEGKIWNVGDIILGDYKVVGVLGRGGMGVVYLVVRSQSTGQKFAVKKLLIGDDDTRRNFLMELQTWLDMPEYPHLVACRFFRTVGDELAIFAEYVEGGSLADWIRNGKLTQLDKILDVAIQFAWGLHAVHELGLVHQDVKPGNALLTPDGIVKVADFGLARAKAVKEKNLGQDPSQSILVSSGGITPAYCSPEQLNRQPLSRKTDIWSWGISVMEMFIGEVTWQVGLAAPQILEHYIANPIRNPAVPRMPAGVIEVLKKCFRSNPTDRWPTLLDAAEALKQIYNNFTGNSYPRQIPAVLQKNLSIATLERVHDSYEWTDPKEWLIKALKAAGRDPVEGLTLIQSNNKSSSRKAQAIADLAIYEEVMHIFEELISMGRKDQKLQLADFYTDKAVIHNFTDDLPGAIALYNRVINIQKQLVSQEGPWEISSQNLAIIYMNKACAVSSLGDNRTAVAIYDKAIGIWERLVNKEGRKELANHLALVYMNKAIAMNDLGDNRTAVAIYDKAIGIWERLVDKEGGEELANYLAMVYMNKARAVNDLGDHRTAVAIYDKAIEIRERLVNQGGRGELANKLAMVYMNKAIAVNDLGDNQTAVAIYDKAIEIRERLVNQEGRGELANDLAMGYMNKAIAVSNLGDHRTAVAIYDKAIEIRERLVNQEGRTELTNDLAMVYMNKATAVSDLGENRTAVAMYDNTIEIWERLVNQEGRTELTNDLAMVYMNKAIAMSDLGENRTAEAMFDKAIEIRERLVNQEGRTELASNLAEAYRNKAILERTLGDNRSAITLYDKAIEIWERLVNQEGRQELTNYLTNAYKNRAALSK